MDFHRMAPNQPQAQRAPASPVEMAPPPKMPEKKSWMATRRRDFLTLGGHIGTNILLFVVTLLIAAVAWLIYSENPPTAEHNYIDTTKLQAIVLNNGQAYFGNIKSLNSNYAVLTNVFYIQQNSTASSTTSKTSTTSTNPLLVKLGCELHGPYDQMVINADQITYWENLKSDSQVAKAVAKYKQENPNGQNCSTAQQSTGTTSLQGQSTTNTDTTK